MTDLDYCGSPPDEPADDPDAAYERRIAQHRMVTEEANRMRARRDARRLVDREEAALANVPPLVRLDEFLRRPLPPVTHCVDQLWPTGGNVLLAAQWKAGKTTLRDNLLRSMVDGEPFLGRFAPVNDGGAIAVLDFELDEHTMQRWLSAHRFRHQQRVFVLPLKGRVSTFNILDDDIRTRWAESLRAAGVTRLFVDCLRPILDALGLDEHRDAGRFLVAFDALGEQAGIPEKLLVHHMGHSGERGRGDSRLQDWPDALWKLTRLKSETDPSTDDPTGPRFLSAFGRDVNVPEGELTYDADTRRLTLADAPANRARARERIKAEGILDDVWQAIYENPGITVRGLRERCKGLGRNGEIDKAAALLIESGRIVVARGPRGALQHTAVTTVPTVPQRAPDTRGTVSQAVCPVPTVPIGTGHTTDGTPSTQELLPLTQGQVGTVEERASA